MYAYQDFLLVVFDAVARTHLCSQAVQNQAMALDRGEAAFREFVKAHPDKFFATLSNKFQTCCHPEFLLNKRYQNEYTQFYAEVWDDIYSDIQSYLGFLDKCTKAWNIIKEVVGSLSFELLKRGVEERNAHTSERMRESVAKGDHPWQQFEFIEAHGKQTSEQLRELAVKGVLGRTWTADVDEAIMIMIKDGVTYKKMHRNWAMA
jgi:hypothetical protein